MITKRELFNKIVFDNVYTYKDISQFISKGTNQIGEAMKNNKKKLDK